MDIQKPYIQPDDNEHNPIFIPQEDESELLPSQEIDPDLEDENFDDDEDEGDEKSSPRRLFRQLLFHILYAADAFDYEVRAEEIAHNFNNEYGTEIDPEGEIVTTVDSIGTMYTHLDDLIVPFLQNWKFERIGKCTLLTLRYAIWEMLETTTPHNIIINEAVELAKAFAEKDAYKFVNGMLDKISHHISEHKEEIVNKIHASLA